MTRFTKRGSTKRRGQSLVEFAIISFVLVTILAGTLGLGVMLLRASVSVVAVSSISNLLDREFESVEIDSEDAIDDNEQLMEVVATTSREPSGPLYFSETDLVLNAEEYFNARDDFELSGLALIIQPLLSLYQYDQLRDKYHFSGSIVKRVSDDALTVLVPLTDSRDSEHRQIISQWRKPIELTYLPATEPGKPAKGTVTINYPASSGVLIAYRDTGDFTRNGDPVRSPISAEISPSSVDLATVFGGTYVIETGGEFDLDSAYAYLDEVRIFQRVFMQSSTFRFREPAP